MNINFNLFFKKIIVILYIYIVVYLANTILFLYLPKQTIDYLGGSSYNIVYNRYNTSFAYKEKVIIKPVVKPKKVIKKAYSLTDNFTIKAIFANGDFSFVLLNIKGKDDTVTLNINESYNNYKLIEVYPKYIIFTKDGKKYRLNIGKNKQKDIVYEVEETVVEKPDLNDIKVTNSGAIVNKNLITKYKKNFKQIWKEISIVDYKVDKKLQGFKIQRIKKNTPFDKLGLKKGDIIKSINNISLTSYAQAFQIYRKINSIKNLNIVIMRDNKEIELNYNIE